MPQPEPRTRPKTGGTPTTPGGLATGAALLIRQGDTVTYTAVRRHGHRVLDWLSQRPPLATEPQALIAAWLEFYQPVRGDLSLAPAGLAITCPQDISLSQEEAAEAWLAAVHAHAQRTLTPEEYHSVRQGGEYLAVIHGNQVLMRHEERWLTLDELLLRSLGKPKNEEGPSAGLRSVFFSDRGIPLVGKADEAAVLTVELAEKWNNLYIIQPEGKVIPFLSEPKYLAAYQALAETFPELIEGRNTWNPLFLWQLSHKLGIVINRIAFDLLIGRWIRERDSAYDEDPQHRRLTLL